jgi:hypothetical protein
MLGRRRVRGAGRRFNKKYWPKPLLPDECIIMKRPILTEIKKVINSPNFFVSKDQRRAIENMHACRTAALGGRVVQCPKCYTRMAIYNPCNTRGCPVCSSRNKVLWKRRVQKKLLPDSHYHLIFCIPQAYTLTWLRNKKKVSNLLFKSASKVIGELRNETGLLLGSVLVFQSHGRGMCYKPHIHCILSAGGINIDGIWEKIGTLKYTEMARRFQQLAYEELVKQIDASGFPEKKDINEKEWYVFSEYHRDNGKSISGYLGSTAYGAVIDLTQNFDITDTSIRFSETHNGKVRETTLDKRIFVERYLNHIPPSGLVTVRYYGLYSNQHVEELKAIRKTFDVEEETEEEVVIDTCPHCQARMYAIVMFPLNMDPEEIEQLCTHGPPKLLPAYSNN